MKLVFHEQAWEDYLYWQKTDRKKLKRLNDLIRQREELDVAIAELREQMKWGEKMIASVTQAKRAAE